MYNRHNCAYPQKLKTLETGHPQELDSMEISHYNDIILPYTHQLPHSLVRSCLTEIDSECTHPVKAKSERDRDQNKRDREGGG